MTILVTGGAGFIGSALIRHLLAADDCRVVNLDWLGYAATLSSLDQVASSPRYAFVCGDICNTDLVGDVLRRYRPEAIVHLAAETHVDRSIDDPSSYVQSNIVGTLSLLEAARRYWRGLDAYERAHFRFLHVSTDEVFGSLGSAGRFTPFSPYQPSSPYSASKAASDHLARAWHITYRLPVMVSNCSNNYGPFQFPEKLIPLMILNALDGRPLPVYGDGLQIRDWLFVEDHARALHTILRRGRPGSTYLVGGDGENNNLSIVQSICDLLDELAPDTAGSYRRLIAFVDDRPGHDRRYAVDSTKLRTELGWRPSVGIEAGLRYTVRWYLDNRSWWEPLRERAAWDRRQGVAS